MRAKEDGAPRNRANFASGKKSQVAVECPGQFFANSKVSIVGAIGSNRLLSALVLVAVSQFVIGTSGGVTTLDLIRESF